MAVIAGSVPVAGTVGPTDSTDVYPVTEPKYQIGGWRDCASVTEMNNIPIPRRRDGMIVSVPNDSNTGYVYYQLRNGVFTIVDFGNGTGGSTGQQSFDFVSVNEPTPLSAGQLWLNINPDSEDLGKVFKAVNVSGTIEWIHATVTVGDVEKLLNYIIVNQL